MKYMVEIYEDERQVCTLITKEHADFGDAQDELHDLIADEIIKQGKTKIEWYGFSWIIHSEGETMPIPSSFVKSMIGHAIAKHKERIRKELGL